MTLHSITSTTPTAERQAPPGHSPPPDLDSALHAQLARLTMGLSPASMTAAYLDWLCHLAVSPAKQQSLALHALRGVADSPATERLDQHRSTSANPVTWRCSSMRANCTCSTT